MMLIDLKIALALHLQRQTAMVGNLIKHMVEELESCIDM